MGEQGIGLEDHADIAVGSRQLCHIDVANENPPGARHLKPGDHAQRGGLAAARWTQQRHQLAGLNIERDVVNSLHGAAIELRDMLEYHR